MRIAVQLQSPVPLSIAELQEQEEMFLSFARQSDSDYGTGIERDGKGPPTVWWQDPEHRITDPHAQRRGAWFIRKGDKIEDDKDTVRALNEAPDENLERDLRAMKDDHAEKDCHEQRFNFPGWQISGMQGCGDLTMNAWNVAYINDGVAPRELIRLRKEDVFARTYSSLVKWKSKLRGRQVVSIEEVRFSRQNNQPCALVLWDGRWLDRSAEIEFAVSNQRVIRDGEVVPALESCHQFGDIRHLLQTPNLNPSTGPLFRGEPQKPGGRYVPRTYFGEERYAEVWLGEQQFIADESRNLLRAALSGPVVLDWPLTAGATVAQVRGALESGRYREMPGTSRLLRPGEWRFLCRRSRDEIAGLEIFFRRNRYGWTMLGMTANGRSVLALACQGFPGEQRGFTLEEAASLFRQAGAHDALLIDEGQDAFQIVDGVDQIPRKRRRLKACFIVAKPQVIERGGDSE
ncbi:MAG: phosphodiester glycosidase family protein [Acidobacteria bacterium]|nr:phosphodiester glycosidase family protein [Acidobacteriota bacterium]